MIVKKITNPPVEGIYSSTLKARVWWVVRDLLSYIPYPVRDFYWKHIRTLWKPQHSRVRKAIPRYWVDKDRILQSVCFEIIKSFYEDEYKAGTVDWEGTGGDAMKFVDWLEQAYTYITSVRPTLEKRIEEAYDTSNYRKVEKLEGQMEDMDTEVLTDLVKWRGHMWT
jgi:hypothetical protein